MRLNSDALLTIIDEETLEKIERFCEGAVVVFNKRKIQKKYIQKEFKRLMQSNIKKVDAIKILATQYNKSERQIRRIVDAKEY